MRKTWLRWVESGYMEGKRTCLSVEEMLRRWNARVRVVTIGLCRSARLTDSRLSCQGQLFVLSFSFLLQVRDGFKAQLQLIILKVKLSRASFDRGNCGVVVSLDCGSTLSLSRDAEDSFVCTPMIFLAGLVNPY